MNKKFISALLFGAMLFAPASMFVSCSYDDDIAELRGDLDATKTDLSSLVDEKMKNVDAEIASLGAQADALEAAYEAADEALQEAIANATNDAKGYADVQAAQAQVAAIAAAQKMVSDAQAALETALAAVNTTIGEHGKSISALLEADKQLTSAIAVAQARADQAYALAEQAQKLATDNAAAIKSLNEALEGLKKTVANLEGQVSVLGEKVTALEKEAQAQAAEIAAQKAALKSLEESNAKALDAAVKAAKDELLKEIEANSKKVADLEDKLAAAEQAAQAAVDAAKTALEAQIAEVAKNLATLAGESAAYTDKKFEEALKAAQAAQKDATDALDQLKDLASKAELEKAAADVQAAADKAQEAADEAKAALEDLVEANAALAGRISALEVVKDAYKDADAALEAKLQEAITNITKDVAALKTELEGKITEVNANLVYQGKKLKSLVFSPTLYYHGIEAFGVYSFNYTPYKEPVAGDLEKNQTNLIDQLQENRYKVSFVPNETVSYIMNPSNALVSKDVKNYSFVVNHAKTTRANTFESANINVTKAEPTADGKLNVTIGLTNPEWIQQLNPSSGTGNVDVVALKYTDKGENGADTTVISDFAAIKHYRITDFQIYAQGNPCAKLADTPAKALEANAVKFTVPYNKFIDFNECLDVHYAIDDVYQEWGNYKKIAEKGFSLQYELMGYISGANQTNESMHAKLEGSVLTPQNVNGTPATRNCVGRTPLVRVKLVDGNNNKIADLGYTIVTITDVFVDPIVKGVYNNKFGYEVSCGTNEFSIGNMMTWLQFETDILGDERINISKSDFALLYELDLVDNQNYAKQFAQAKDGSFSEVTAWGKVRMTGADDAANQTKVLFWTVENTSAYNWFKWNNNPVNTSKTVFVRFKPANTDDQNYHRPYIYVKLSWTPEYTRTKPEAAIKDTDKVAATWYAADSKQQGTSDLHAHVEEAKTGNSCVFDFSVDKHTFKKADGSIVSVAEVIKNSMEDNKYTKVAGNTKITFMFAHNNGVPAATSKAGSSKYGKADYYSLRIYNNNVLQARHGNESWSDVAILDVDNGSIAYQTNTVAKDILNYASSQELVIGQSLTVKVEILANTCTPAGKVYLSGHQMNVKFLRPVNLSDEAVQVVDSDPSTHTIELGKGKDFELKLTDWRDFDNNQVYASSNKAYNLYQFYGVTSIKQDADRKVMSNFANGGSADLANCTVLPSTEFVFKFNESTSLDSKNQGTITYVKNTTVTVHDFTAYVPVVVTYTWGELYGWVRVDVKATVNN